MKRNQMRVEMKRKRKKRTMKQNRMSRMMKQNRMRRKTKQNRKRTKNLIWKRRWRRKYAIPMIRNYHHLPGHTPRTHRSRARPDNHHHQCKR